MTRWIEGSREGWHQVASRGDDIDLRELLAALWQRKYVIAAVTIACCALVLASSYLFERKYETSVVFVTVTDDAGDRAGGLSALASQFGGLAALGGISLSGSERKEEYLAILKSQALIERFITRNNLIPVLYADDWDEARHAWRETDPKKQPTTWKAIQRFQSRIMRLTTDGKTGISMLSITWADAATGARWANELVAMANDHVRARTIEEAERNVAYLNAQLTKTSVVAVQNSISTLLENQIKKIMLAQGSEQYAFRVIDPALPAEKPSFPNRIAWLIFGFVAGFLSSSAFVVFGRSRIPPGASSIT